jgi:hypothetical protein
MQFFAAKTLLGFLLSTPERQSELRDQTYRELVYCLLQFHERSQHFIAAHDETLSVAMRVHNPHCSPIEIES